MHPSEQNDLVSRHMVREFAALPADQTVADAVAWLRAHPPTGRTLYLYVVDGDGVLRGVVPTRRLILAPPDSRLADIMVGNVIAVPADASVLEACEFFILHRLLALPVVDARGKLVGVIDIDLYTRILDHLADRAPAQRLLRPLTDFLHIESAGGIVLMACTIIAVIAANSPWADAYAEFWQTSIRFDVGSFALHKPLVLWVNDGLMTLFFFVVGLEIKREVVTGELNDWHKAMLPIAAAIGGMIAPAGIYLALQWGTDTANGWGVPTATDIAFVVGFLTLLGPRVPHGLKVLLLSLAIGDDIGAVVVIAVGYNVGISFGALALGVVGLCLVKFLRWAGIHNLLTYTALGVAIWVCFLKSGVHPTVAGVVLGLLTPALPLLGDRTPIDLVTDLMRRVSGLHGPAAPASEPASPLDRLEHALHPWVAFVIMPVFALANAGVPLSLGHVTAPVSLAITAGLVIGKPLGIVIFSLAAVRAGIAKLPAGVTLPHLVGAGCLAGIGFTMSIFIASLAFDAAHLDGAKVGIFVGSAVSAVAGMLLLHVTLPAHPNK